MSWMNDLASAAGIPAGAAPLYRFSFLEDSMSQDRDSAPAITQEAIEIALQFLASEDGKKLLEARREWAELRDNLRTSVQQMKISIRSESDELRHVYSAVGEFVVRFSQLEFGFGWHLAGKLR